MTAAEAPAVPLRLRHPVLWYAARRIVAGVVTLFVLSAVVFFATSILPGDAASSLLGKNASGEALALLRHEMGLDQPLLQQYGDWLGGLLHGDFGRSAAGFAAGGEVTVWSQISGPLAASAQLALVAFIPIVVVSVALGILSALRAGRWTDHLISALTIVPAAVPEFVLGAVLLVVFFGWLKVLPPVSLVQPGESPLAKPELLVLPVLTLVGVTAGPGARMVRAGVIETLESDYVAAARLNGVRERKVVLRYAVRNALAPSIQVLALVVQYLIGGMLIVEYLFGYPGIGKELVDAITIHDTSEVQSVSMLLAAIYVGVTIVADLIVVVLVPKLRTGAP
ncbi:ABC transporter permease [Amycolatopsis jejuensis]|uniref:ABC transporter permease n=1 Tax=Amycolatopsis jejuensis TaxID=330084 RepID=UPI00068F5AC9|nr:ABC transporter permease [Amycolatopsis jejuensis]